MTSAGAVLRSRRLCGNSHPHRQDRARPAPTPACHPTKPQVTDLRTDFDEALGATEGRERSERGAWQSGRFHASRAVATNP